MSLSEYIALFVLVAIMGAGLPGPGDAVVIGLVMRAGLASWRRGPAERATTVRSSKE